MSNEVMTRNSEWMNHIVNHLNRMVDNFERAVMNYRPMLGGERKDTLSRVRHSEDSDG